MEEGVGAPVELERANAEAVAERAVEGRGRFDPSSPEREFGIAVVVEDVAPHQRAQPRSAEVVAHVSEAEPGRDARCACPRGQEGGLGHTEPPAARQARARPVGLGRAEIGVRRVGDVVADRVVEAYGAPSLIGLVAADVAAPGHHSRVVAVHECRGGEVVGLIVGGGHRPQGPIRLSPSVGSDPVQRPLARRSLEDLDAAVLHGRELNGVACSPQAADRALG